MWVHRINIKMRDCFFDAYQARIKNCESGSAASQQFEALANTRQLRNHCYFFVNFYLLFGIEKFSQFGPSSPLCPQLDFLG